MSRGLMFGIVVAALGCLGALGACTPAAPEAKVCQAAIKIHHGLENPLDPSGTVGDVARIQVVRDGVVARNLDVDLFGAPDQIEPISFIDPSDSEAEPLEASTNFQVRMTVYSSVTRQVIAVGKSPVFSCTGDASTEVPLFLGPANDAADLGPIPGGRVGAKAVHLGEGRVLVVGGQKADGTNATPSFFLYDHAVGSFCAPPDCASDQGAPSGRIHHQVISLGDGRAVVLGGEDAGTGEVIATLHLYDDANQTWTQLESTLPRTRMGAVHIRGFNVGQASLDGKILVMGGLDDSDPATLRADGLLLDVDGDALSSANASLAVARTSPAVAMLSSGDVLVAGGRNSSQSPLASAEIFRTEQSAFVEMLTSCPNDPVGASLCAQRADAAMQVLSDDSVLLWGGQTVDLDSGFAAPPAEVFVLIPQEQFLPLLASGLPSDERRIGHAISLLQCESESCPRLVSGGVNPSDSSALEPMLLDSGQAQSATYSGTVTKSQGIRPAFSVRDHIAVELGNGSVLLLGGEDPTTGLLQPNGSVFTHCDEALLEGTEGASSLSCPDF
jgi:hypothetical protein